MSDTKKNIPVHFVKFERYKQSYISNSISFLGNISDDERVKIMDAFPHIPPRQTPVFRT